MLDSKRILKIYTTWKRVGSLGFINLIISHYKKPLICLAMSPLTIPIAFIIFLISPFKRIRFFMLSSDRIGHYAWVTEQILCINDLTQSTNSTSIKTFFYTIPGKPIANKQLHKMWKRVIPILPFPHLCFEIDRLLLFFSRAYRNDPVKHYFTMGDGSDRWNLLGKVKKCHIAFTKKEIDQGQKFLEKLGIPQNAKFVCLLGRDSQYLNTYMPKVDTSYHEYRNVDINNYKQAAEFLSKKGYYVIRMGKYVKEKFNLNNPKVIDYANHPLRSDFMDIYLSANCFFFISVGSGLDGVAQIFRKPILITNFPVCDRGIWPDWHLLIFKKTMEKKSKRYLTLQETFKEFANIRLIQFSQILQERGLQFVENTPNEITEAVEEMLASLTGNQQCTKEDDLLQKSFWRNYQSRFTEDVSALKLPVFDYNKPTTEDNRTLRIGKKFLQNNSFFLN